MSEAAVHSSGCQTARPSTAPAVGSPGSTTSATFHSPRKTGVLADSYESRFGGRNFIAQDTSGIEAIVTPRPSKRIVDTSSLSNPCNPFQRNQSKLITHIDEVRADTSRAGRKTFNPSMICQDQRTSDHKAMTFGYSTTGDWRPGKAFGGGARGTGNPTVLSEVSGGGVNEVHNYLNDMKGSTNSRRGQQMPPPSASLQRMKDRETLLPAEMEGSHERKVPVPTTTQRKQGKRIIGPSYSATPDMLVHKYEKAPEKRFERLEQAADKHFATIVHHMKQATSEPRMYRELFRARAQSSLGLGFASEEPH
eukprot:gnl/MRDRNA2_/MRDRNA2_129760_c0_seq1.p1 gnl/MRDRNA2_/MRDRNA2_129760_c0~~gnl/MRDRNA2_/MRDRNA2_129760_c0_seq1.p1  ORF type:complete len:308 (-),score=44.97 gnl/MRDRNA2_/MRDRNA2_129760_c0_seq1:187-1110(-)